MSDYKKVEYDRVNWQDKSTSLKTPINASNLNRMDKAIKELCGNLDIVHNENGEKKEISVGRGLDTEYNSEVEGTQIVLDSDCVEINNWDEAFNTGFYFSSMTAKGIPEDAKQRGGAFFGIILCAVDNASKSRVYHQIGMVYKNGTNEFHGITKYERVYIAGSWSDWKKINDFTEDEKTKLSGVATGANAYTHPSYTPRSSGLYKITVDGSGHISSVTAVTKEDIIKLGIPGQDTDTTYGAATQSSNGLMSAADKKKLDGVATGANAYTHPSYTPRSSGLYKITVDGSGHISSVTAVTKEDITKLGIPAQDTNTWRGVVNNLTSTAIDQSLAAAQGKALNDKITTLNSSLKGFGLKIRYENIVSTTINTNNTNTSQWGNIDKNFLPVNNSKYTNCQLCVRVKDSYGISYFYTDAEDFFTQALYQDTSKYGWQMIMGTGELTRYVSVYFNGSNTSPAIRFYTSYKPVTIELYMMSWYLS